MEHERELALAARLLGVKREEVSEVSELKKGMTNHSFLFHCKGKKYIMRIPGEGTDKLVNREEEAAVYQIIKGRGICDNVVYIAPDSGYKITEYMEGARTCNPSDWEDVRKCMGKLRQFHELNLTAEHTFDLFRMIDFYESLRNGTPSMYPDYDETKKRVRSLGIFIASQKPEQVLTHIDAVPDNFLIGWDGEGKEDIRLIDWEYAGMQDPHVDIAMFCVYAMYGKDQADELIKAYFTEGCMHCTKIKIYCYIAICGLLWSNWCEYKRLLGVKFGEYALRQYGYAKEFSLLARNEIRKMDGERG
ncbi:choline kinase family protein [Lachnospiraceae bacterium 56-18]|jgi:thiamine kinase-like enzyme